MPFVCGFPPLSKNGLKSWIRWLTLTERNLSTKHIVEVTISASTMKKKNSSCSEHNMFVTTILLVNWVRHTIMSKILLTSNDTQKKRIISLRAQCLNFQSKFPNVNIGNFTKYIDIMYGLSVKCFQFTVERPNPPS